MQLDKEQAARDLGAKLFEAWAQAFAKNQPQAMAPFYVDGSMLYGSKAELFRGPEGALAYFAGLAPRKTRSVRFSDITASFANETVLALASTAHFQVDDAPVLEMRFTQTWTLHGGEWKVISHHASPRQSFSV